MEKFGCPSKFIKIVRQFHDGMMVKILDDGDALKAFTVTKGVKQDCALASTVFSTVFSAMLTDALCDCQDGIPVRYRTDGGRFTLRNLQAVTKVKETVIRDFLFADNCTLNANKEQKMPHEMDCFWRACDNFGLTISTKMARATHQPVPGKPYQEPHITLNGQSLQAVDNFTYLGSTLSREVNIDVEVNNRIDKASTALGRLCQTVWEWRGLSQ